jgi:SAM-dependent methyltransferase
MTEDIKQFEHKSYEAYVEEQTKGNKRKIHKVWAQPDNIALLVRRFLDRFLAAHNPSQPLPTSFLVLCHGTRNGAEQGYFREAFKQCGFDAQVLGTEISETATQFPDTIQHDFHEPLPLSVPQTYHIVYTNSLDHAYDGAKAVNAWLDQLKPNGTLVIEHSTDDEPSKVNSLDCFGVSINYFPMWLLRNTKGYVTSAHLMPYLPQNTEKTTVTWHFVVEKR